MIYDLCKCNSPSAASRSVEGAVDEAVDSDDDSKVNVDLEVLKTTPKKPAAAAGSRTSSASSPEGLRIRAAAITNAPLNERTGQRKTPRNAKRDNRI